MEEHPQARFIVDTLSRAGFVAYYAGGWVRDLLLQHPSDDIDIATNAPPETIQALFPHTVPVGIAFGIIIVIIDGHQYEVATFRQDLDYKDGRRPSRIEFTTAEEDAKRRDFTINGMFYDPIRQEVLDYVGGKADLEARIIRAIGNPHQRIQEDRLRMIRAIRLSCRFHFHIDEATAQAIRSHATELFPSVAIERIWQEFTKGHDFGKLRPMLIQLHEFDLLATIFPPLKGLSLHTLEKQLAPIDNYPKEAPVIASLLPLFPEYSLDEQLFLSKKLKLSAADLQFVVFLYEGKELLEKGEAAELAEWAPFYAHPSAQWVLQIKAAHLAIEKREPFWNSHQKRIAFLHRSIERIRDRNLVVKAENLLCEGIQPGPFLGKLLKEAERISINQQIENPHQIIEQLKHSNLWPR